ncbi:hypothetical protein OIE73_13600 [Streptomyces hirsutus]|uniref:Chaplin domain-containing protein n=1 Tax=Streptomyces hirsutus TaxID=35620 RepID=A0ABZ1GLA8_9ACTN|nr:hypothetical protein [Streptomyces hirsutus]WSD06708.1 hypothetical protein OIE73_13590 [Streptomyces hirsutus]WSD06710.1 hypothetical protein OIE73_13600 [Streptomyces hirsutus]
MLSSKKIAATAAAGILGGFALLGFGATQAFADDGAGKCVDDGNGIHCVQSQTCSGGGQVDCGSVIVIGGKKSES